MDDYDICILNALIKDGKAKIRTLSGDVGLSESACHARLKRLERSGYIRGYQAVIAFHKIGFFHAWADVTLTNDSSHAVAAFERIACAAPEVIAAFLIDGPCHFRLETVAQTFENWQAFAERLLRHSELVLRVERRPIFKSCALQAEKT